jgi:hypothetical protein
MHVVGQFDHPIHRNVGGGYILAPEAIPPRGASGLLGLMVATTNAGFALPGIMQAAVAAPEWTRPSDPWRVPDSAGVPDRPASISR